MLAKATKTTPEDVMPLMVLEGSAEQATPLALEHDTDMHQVVSAPGDWDHLFQENTSDSAESEVSESAEPTLMFNGRPIVVDRTVSMLVTAYSPDARSCGKWADGITASGMSVWTNGMKLVAADTRILPFNTIISIPGYNDGQPVPVLDRGGKIKGHRLDVLYPTHEIARRWGVQRLEITVYRYADE